MKSYLLVEGHGEVEAAGNLIPRLTRDLGLSLLWDKPRRWKNLHGQEGLTKGARYVQGRGDASGLLVLRDEDDACPRAKGPELAGWLRALALPFPAALVLLHPEYEVLFLPCLAAMAGRPLGQGSLERPGLDAGTRWNGPWEARRGIKEWLSAHFAAGRAYKERTDQLALTRMIDLQTLRAADVPCFGTLERALRFLATATEGVYP